MSKDQKVTTNEEIIEALVRDLVDFAIQSKKVLNTCSFNLDALSEAVLLEKMSEEVLNKFTAKSEDIATTEEN